MTSQLLKPGDCVTTPTRRPGRIVSPRWKMPHHCLIAFDDGRLLWMPREILTPAVAASPARQKRRAAA